MVCSAQLFVGEENVPELSTVWMKEADLFIEMNQSVFNRSRLIITGVAWSGVQGGKEGNGLWYVLHTLLIKLEDLCVYFPYS